MRIRPRRLAAVRDAERSLARLANAGESFLGDPERRLARFTRCSPWEGDPLSKSVGAESSDEGPALTATPP